MAGPKQFPKAIGDTPYNDDILPDVIKADGTTILASDYGLPSSRIGTIIRATDTTTSTPFINFTVSTSTSVPRFSAYAEIGAAGGSGAGGGGDYGKNFNGPGGGGGGGSNYAFTTTLVSPGDSITIVIGAGGTCYGFNPGSPGGSSSVTTPLGTFVAGGGGGGGPSRNAYGGAGANGANPGTSGSYQVGGIGGTSTNGGNNGGPGGTYNNGNPSPGAFGTAGKVKIRFYN